MHDQHIAVPTPGRSRSARRRLRPPRGVVFALLAVFVWLPGGASRADQRDPKLAGLFQDLQSAMSPVDASLAMREIWRIWNTPTDPELEQLMREGSIALERDDSERAVQIFSQVIERDPGFAEGWNKRATAYYNLKNYEASILDVGNVLELEPRHFAAILGMGLIYSELGAEATALRWFERALAINPYLANVPEQIDAIRRRLHEGEI